MAIAVAPFEMARGDLGADHQHRTRIARADVVSGGLNAEGRRRAGDIHVEAEAVDPQRLLDLDRHRRIGALHVRGSAQHRVDIFRLAPCPLQRLPRGGNADLGHHRDFVIRTLGQARTHGFGIEDRRLAHHMARLDPARLLDELDRGIGQGLGIGMGRIVAVDESVEARHQLGIGDALFGREQAGGGDDRAARKGGLHFLHGTLLHGTRALLPALPRCKPCVPRLPLIIGIKQFAQQRIGEGARDGDGVEFLRKTRQLGEFIERAVGELVAHHDRRDHGNAGVRACEQAQHRHVVSLRRDAWHDPEAFDQRVEPGAKGSLGRGEDQRGHRQQNGQPLRSQRKPRAAADEADRLDLSLDIIEAIVSDDELGDWAGFGLAVQAYQKRAIFVIEWLTELARKVNRKLMVRLVKGAYWDTEIKTTQQKGLDHYPVFTRKASTDVSYKACAIKLLEARDVLYPQFATHNAYTAATILEVAKGNNTGFEFQRLHGMGESLFDQIVTEEKIQCRVYAPVGEHENLLAYLVRRLLENGANSSFVNRIGDETVSIDDLIADPADVTRAHAKPGSQHDKIALPRELYGKA